HTSKTDTNFKGFSLGLMLLQSGSATIPISGYFFRAHQLSPSPLDVKIGLGAYTQLLASTDNLIYFWQMATTQVPLGVFIRSYDNLLSYITQTWDLTPAYLNEPVNLTLVKNNTAYGLEYDFPKVRLGFEYKSGKIFDTLSLDGTQGNYYFNYSNRNSKYDLFADKNTFAFGVEELPVAMGKDKTMFLNAELSLNKASGRQLQNYITLMLDMPLENDNRLRINASNAKSKPVADIEKFDEETLLFASNNGTKVIIGIDESKDYDSMLSYLKEDIGVTDGKHLKWTLATFSAILTDINYNPEKSYFDGTLSNPEIYQLIKDDLDYKVALGNPDKVLACRDVALFLTTLAKDLQVPGVETVPIRVFKKDRWHDVAMIKDETGITIIDEKAVYIINTGDVEVAWNTYQKAKGNIALDHSIYTPDGKLLGMFTTPEGEQIQQSLLLLGKNDDAGDLLKDLIR
ncbi:MAG: hypothetical protein ABIH01_04600, partial [Candidatus Omnitrophota bacterium]